MPQHPNKMIKRPFGLVSILFVTGLIFARLFLSQYSFYFLFIAAVISVLMTSVFIRHRNISNIFLYLSIFLSAGVLYLNASTYPRNNIIYFLEKTKTNLDIVGIIRSPVERREGLFGKVNSRYLFEIEAIKDNKKGWLKTCGFAYIKIRSEKDYRYGDRLLVKGTIKKPIDATSRSLNYRTYLENQDISAIINTSEKNVTLLSHNYRANPILRYAYLVREKIKSQLLEKMPLESGAFLRAILLGDRSELSRDIQRSFRDSGTMHILAISGLHVGLVVVLFLYLFRFIRIRREFLYPVIIVLLLFLMVLTGSRPPVVRAVIMSIIFLLGMLLGRPVDPYNTLAFAAIFILVKNPKELFNPGFQLSFLAVLSILYFTPRLGGFLKDRMNIYVRKYLWSPFVVSLSASIGTAPIILYHFRMLVPISIVANLVIIPLMFFTMVSGLIFAAFGWVSSIGGLLAWCNNLFVSLIFFFARFFADIKFGHFYV